MYKLKISILITISWDWIVNFCSLCFMSKRIYAFFGFKKRCYRVSSECINIKQIHAKYEYLIMMLVYENRLLFVWLSILQYQVKLLAYRIKRLLYSRVMSSL